MFPSNDVAEFLEEKGFSWESMGTVIMDRLIHSSMLHPHLIFSTKNVEVLSLVFFLLRVTRDYTRENNRSSTITFAGVNTDMQFHCLL